MTRKRIIVPLLLGVCLAIGVYTLNFARTKKPVSPQSRQTAPFTQEIASCVNGIRVVKAEVLDAGTPNATVEVQIENVSDLGIVAVSLEANKDSESYMTSLRSSFKEGKPIVVMKPHQTGKLTIPPSFSDVPLLVGGVFYEDGTEEGCESSLKTLHEVRAHEQPKKESSHETNPQSSDLSSR